MGAEVIKVERAPKGDDTRRLIGFGGGFFPFFNRNKKSIVIDLKFEKEKAILKKLICTADVLIENFAPETVDRLGFGYDEASKINPRLIYYSKRKIRQAGVHSHSNFESTAFLMGQYMALSAVSGKPAPPMPNRVSAWSIYDLFESKDGEMVFVGVTSDSQWKRFCEILDLPSLYADERLSTKL